MVLRLPLLPRIFCRELTSPFHRHICFAQWTLGIVYALVCGVFVLRAKYCIPDKQCDVLVLPWLWGNSSRTMPRQTWTSKPGGDRDVAAPLWREEMLALLHCRMGVGPFYLLDITIKDHFSSSQPTSPLGSYLPRQKMFKQKL